LRPNKPRKSRAGIKSLVHHGVSHALFGLKMEFVALLRLIE